jgi:redox-sensitive bicupin YhaK (pirin superfamily)
VVSLGGLVAVTLAGVGLPVLLTPGTGVTWPGCHTGPMVARSIDRIEDKVRLGPDAQVDEKALIIMPSDPRRTDPFLALAEDWFSEPGFEWHPHRGIETVTTVLDGVLEHGDNLGNAGALQPGDVQWMTAGRGIIHRELAFKNEFAHTLQLWVNLPSSKKMVHTDYQDLRADARPIIEAPGVRVDVISGTIAGTTGPAANQHPILGSVVTLEPGVTFDLDIPASHRAFIYVLDGAAVVGGRPVSDGQIAWSDPSRDGSSSLRLASTAPDALTRLMVYSGKPLREPVVLGGPFVMNSRAEIEAAYRDFHAGAFGAVPRTARLKRA